jgi:ribonuclease J
LKQKLRIIPLGGAGEVGKNMTLIEWDGQALAIDCGLMFPEGDMLGIDLVIPDITYLRQNPELLRGIIFTHGHEDHIGALPYVLKEMDVPLYATRLTRGLIEIRLRDAKLLDHAMLNTIKAGERLRIGPFEVEVFPVSHSIPDAVGIAIYTPLGIVIHTGEYKFDYTPVDGRLTDVGALARFGEEGVLALLADSTNAERQGYTPSEQSVSATFADIFSQAQGRIIVSTFASNISRIQQVIDCAIQYQRSVCIVGRSMVETVRIASNLGYLNAPLDILIKPEDLSFLPPTSVVIICTGTQGEPTSVLVRMANKEHRQVGIQAGDTVVLSASPIPGNEELVHRTLNKLFRLGANVFYNTLLPVHVSGHASQEEQKMMISLTRPRYFIPIGGEYRHLVLHGRLAEKLGIPRENIFIIENGQVVEFDQVHAGLGESIEVGQILIDGLGVGDIGDVVLHDRHLLSRDGFVVVVVAIDETTGQLIDGPEIVSRGFVYIRDAEELIQEAKTLILETLAGGTLDRQLAAETIREVLSSFILKRMKRRPMIFPVVLGI